MSVFIIGIIVFFASTIIIRVEWYQRVLRWVTIPIAIYAIVFMLILPFLPPAGSGGIHGGHYCSRNANSIGC